MPAASNRGRDRAWMWVGVAVVCSVGMVVGAIYLVVTTLRPTKTTSGPAVKASVRAEPTHFPTTDVSAEAMDALARRPMLQLPPSAAQPQPLVDTLAGPPITLPKAGANELVPTGFPQTPQGALAQLAVIDRAAVQNLSRRQVDQVYRWAALPGAVPQQEWNMQVAVSAALRGADLPDTTSNMQFSYTVTHAQIKGVLNEGKFVVACVLGEVDGNYRSSARVGMGDCQRMVWSGNRWRIGPGAQPAYAPNAWPGSADCVRAGWRAVKYA